MVNATVQPCSSSRRIPSKARTAPLELDPRTFTNPNFCIIRPVYSPSKLSLLMTRTSRSRHQYIAGIMQLCQKEYTQGRSARLLGDPSSQETANRIVGPSNRITRCPAHVISQRRIRSLSVNVRQGFSTRDGLGVMTAFTMQL